MAIARNAPHKRVKACSGNWPLIGKDGSPPMAMARKNKCPACIKIEITPGQWKHAVLLAGEETVPQYCPHCKAVIEGYARMVTINYGRDRKK